ncbi:MAG: ATP-binding protein [Gemmatimonadota bacterium]
MAHSTKVFVGRSRELGLVRSAFDGPDASIVRIEGMRGIGKSALVARALENFQHLIFRVPALPAPLQRRALAMALLGEVGSPPSWDELFAAAVRRARVGEGPFVLVLDDVHRLGEARSRYMEPLLGALRTARSNRRALHVVLVGAPYGDPPADGSDGWVAERVTIGPLPLRPASELLPGADPRDILRAYGLLGGIPRVLAAVDPEVTLGTNIRRLILDPEGPFADIPSIWLERDLQTPSRYNAVLAQLAFGECDWGGIHASVPDLTSSGQLAPYVRRLEELGLVSVRRSLDADPGSRSRRYSLTDPLLAFWYRFVLPGSPTGQWSPDIKLGDMRDDLDDHLATIFPLVCRQHMAHDAIETLGANARELGSLWGAEYELPVAGILTSGAAFYGTCSWRPPVRGEDPLGTLDASARGTRYGFGREHRLRLHFMSIEPPRWLERAAVRQDQCLLMGPSALVGDDRPTPR